HLIGHSLSKLEYPVSIEGKLTGKEMSSILEVTAEQIHSIKSPVLLVDLLRKLLHAEARSHGISRRGVSVPAQITVSDDGEDAIIEWHEGPDSTDYLPARVCMLQSKATNMPKAKCANEVKDKDGNLKPAIRHALENGGAYIVFSTDKNDRSTKLRERIEGIRTGIKDATGDQFPGALIDFYGSNKICDWVNKHPSVAIWALRELFGRQVSTFQSWESWSRDPNIDASHYRFVPGKSVDGTLDHNR